jgi:hypothetical protein
MVLIAGAAPATETPNSSVGMREVSSASGTLPRGSSVIQIDGLQPSRVYTALFSTKKADGSDSEFKALTIRTLSRSGLIWDTAQPCLGQAETVASSFEASFRIVSELDPGTPLRGGGAFYREEGGLWTYSAGDYEGLVSVRLSPGVNYISTLPGIRQSFLAERRTYKVEVDENGMFKILDAKSLAGVCHLEVSLSKAAVSRRALINSTRLTQSATAQPVKVPPSRVKYLLPKSNLFGREIYTELYVWEGQKVALLTQTNALSAIAVGKYLQTLDRAYEAYGELTGQFPFLDENRSPWARTHNGKLVVASIPSIENSDSQALISCGGNACAAYETFGIEIRWQVLESTLWMIENFELYDHTGIYELGRNFWPHSKCTPALAMPDGQTVAPTGFAVLMMHFLSNTLGIENGPEDEVSGALHQLRIRNLINELERDPSLNLNQLTTDVKIDGLDRNAIWASMLHRLGDELGGYGFYKRLFSNCSSLPKAKTNLDALLNLKRAAENASGRNLDELFFIKWKLRI